MVAMADLRAACGKLGFKNPRTLLNSGNLLVESSASPTEVEAQLEQGMKKRLGRDLEFFVRSRTEWEAIIRANPFKKEAAADPGRTVLLCLKDKVTPAAMKDLQTKIPGRESVEGRGREVYAYYPDGQGTSSFPGLSPRGQVHHMPIHLEPIGFVRSPRTGLEDDHWGDVESQIELSHGISAEALDGIEG